LSNLESGAARWLAQGALGRGAGADTYMTEIGDSEAHTLYGIGKAMGK